MVPVETETLELLQLWQREPAGLGKNCYTRNEANGRLSTHTSCPWRAVAERTDCE